MMIPRGGYVAQLVEHRTGNRPTQVRFPGAEGVCLPRSTFSTDSLTVFVHTRVESQAITSVRTLKIPWSMSEFGGIMETLKHPACTVATK